MPLRRWRPWADVQSAWPVILFRVQRTPDYRTIFIELPRLVIVDYSEQDGKYGGGSVNWFLIIAAIFITWVVFNWLVNVLKTTLTTAFTVAAIILVLQLVVGIGPQQVLDTILSLPRLAIEALQK